MLIVIDNVLESIKQEAVADYFQTTTEKEQVWVDTNIQSVHTDQSPAYLLLKEASRFFDLSDMQGFEYWCHNGTRPDWHFDKDELLMNRSGNIKMPICSIVYYAFVKDLQGGWFVTETERIKPKTNRLIIFSPGTFHTVEFYIGKRVSVAINPWTNKPEGY